MSAPSWRFEKVRAYIADHGTVNIDAVIDLCDCERFDAAKLLSRWTREEKKLRRVGRGIYSLIEVDSQDSSARGAEYCLGGVE
jgi:predicted transcriptional regulator of viral defense system